MSMEASHMGPVRTVISSWWLALLIGVGLIGLGLAAILGLYIFTTVLALLTGGILALTGVLLVILALSGEEETKDKIITGLIGLAALIAGVYLLFNPGVGLAITTLVLAIFFPLEGIAKISMALGMRDFPKWWMMLVSGVVSVGLGIVIWVEGLSIASRNIGLLLGIDLLVIGIVLVMMAMSSRDVTRG